MKLRAQSLVAVLAAVVLLAGCGGGDSDADATDDSESSAAAESETAESDAAESDAAESDAAESDAAESDFAEQSGEDIAEAAKTDMRGLEQVEYVGTITSDGTDITLDVQASGTGECTGSIGVAGGSAEIVAKDGTSWYRPDEAFWRATIPDQADQVIAAIGDKWVLDTDANFTQFCDLDAFFDNLFADDSEGGTFEATGTDTLDGQDVVTVEKTDDDGTTIGYVLVDEEHYLLKIEKSGGTDSGQVEFGKFNETFEVTAPAETEVFDISQLG